MKNFSDETQKLRKRAVLKVIFRRYIMLLLIPLTFFLLYLIGKLSAAKFLNKHEITIIPGILLGLFTFSISAVIILIIVLVVAIIVQMIIEFIEYIRKEKTFINLNKHISNFLTILAKPLKAEKKEFEYEVQQQIEREKAKQKNK